MKLMAVDDDLMYVRVHAGEWITKPFVAAVAAACTPTKTPGERQGVEQVGTDAVQQVAENRKDIVLSLGAPGGFLPAGFEPMQGEDLAVEGGGLLRDGGVKPMRHFSVEDTVIIFDWDDTLLPSTWVSNQKLRLDKSSVLTSHQQEQLSEVARTVSSTLCAAKQLGTVVIVTNAEKGWIELTCHKFMPSLAPILEGVKILSARSTYETKERTSPLDWKLRAFEGEVRRIYGTSLEAPSRCKNVVSIGDSVHERKAVLKCTAGLPNCRTKSLKLVAKPEIGQISKQHLLMAEWLAHVIHHEGNLDLSLKPQP